MKLEDIRYTTGQGYLQFHKGDAYKYLDIPLIGDGNIYVNVENLIYMCGACSKPDKVPHLMLRYEEIFAKFVGHVILGGKQC